VLSANKCLAQPLSLQKAKENGANKALILVVQFSWRQWFHSNNPRVRFELIYSVLFFILHGLQFTLCNATPSLSLQVLRRLPKVRDSAFLAERTAA